MKDWNVDQIAAAAEALSVAKVEVVPAADAAVSTNAEPGSLARGPQSSVAPNHQNSPKDEGPLRVVIDSREIQAGDLFIALEGANVDGGRFALEALQAGAWGVIVTSKWARKLSSADKDVGKGDSTSSELQDFLNKHPSSHTSGAASGADGVSPSSNTDVGNVIEVQDPLRSLASLARAWRKELDCKVIAITGSVGKTSTKDLLANLLSAHRSVFATRANFNTEIGMPLQMLSAPRGTEVMVLELAARGFGQISQLAEICLPDVGIITKIAPVHLNQFGSLEGVARVKGELFESIVDQCTIVTPAGESKLLPYIRPELNVLTFGPDGYVHYLDPNFVDSPIENREARIVANGNEIRLTLNFSQRHHRVNLLAAVAAALAVGVTPSGEIDPEFTSLRGEQIDLENGASIISDCYNASPVAMENALQDLSNRKVTGSRIAVLGDMLELGPREYSYHRAVGHQANETGINMLITVGSRARAMAEVFEGESHSVADTAEATELLRQRLKDGDLVLVKASRGMGLEAIVDSLAIMSSKSAVGGNPSPESAVGVNLNSESVAGGNPSSKSAVGAESVAGETQSTSPTVS